MLKRVLTLSLVLALVLSVTAQAAIAPLSIRQTANLTFSGTTATCTTSVQGERISDTISCTMQLCNDSGTVIQTWKGSGTGSVRLSKTYRVTKGATYILLISATVNGVSQSPKSIMRTCP